MSDIQDLRRLAAETTRAIERYRKAGDRAAERKAVAQLDRILGQISAIIAQRRGNRR